MSATRILVGLLATVASASTSAAVAAGKAEPVAKPATNRSKGAILPRAGVKQCLGAEADGRIKAAVKRLEAGQAADAKERLQAFHSKGGLEARRLFHLARAYAALGDFELAVESSRRAYAADPRLDNAWFNVLCYLARGGKQAEAHAQLVLFVEKVTKADPRKRARIRSMLEGDPDLASLRARPGTRELIASLGSDDTPIPLPPVPAADPLPGSTIPPGGIEENEEWGCPACGMG